MTDVPELGAEGIEAAIASWPRAWEEYSLRTALSKAITAYLQCHPTHLVQDGLAVPAWQEEREKLIAALTEILRLTEWADEYDGERLSPEEVYMGAVDGINGIARRALPSAPAQEEG